MNRRSFLHPLWFAAAPFVAGCMQRNRTMEKAAFDDSKLTSVCAVLFDMSASFRETLDRRGYRLFMEISDRHTTASMGVEAKLIVGQLSAEVEQIVLFEGSPADFRKRFRGPNEFSAFLKTKSKADGSPVSESVRRSLSYLVSTSGITKDTRLTFVVLSDMRETPTTSTKRAELEEGLRDALKEFQTKGGAIALYYVAEQLREKWYRRLKDCGFMPDQYVVETELSESPRLPKFE